MTFRIRAATALDREAIRDVHLRAFSPLEGQAVAKLAGDLTCIRSTPATIGLVAEAQGAVVGHVAFSPVTADLGAPWQGYLLAPLGVVPEQQTAGVGSQLIEAGVAHVSASGADVVFVYGDPAYYGRFGFQRETATRFLPPYDLQYPFGWQAVVLHGDPADERIARISCVAPLCDPSLW